MGIAACGASITIHEGALAPLVANVLADRPLGARRLAPAESLVARIYRRISGCHAKNGNHHNGARQYGQLSERRRDRPGIVLLDGNHFVAPMMLQESSFADDRHPQE
jgi:hypothetical protein